MCLRCRFECGGVQRRRALHRHLQRERAFFGDAFLAADQPGRLQLEGRVLGERAGVEGACHRHRHGQQHGVFITVVGQRAERNLVRHGPGDLARVYAFGQLPFELRGQARVAGVLPVGVPLGLVRDLQTEQQRLAGADAVGCLRDQLGLHMRRGDGAAARTADTAHGCAAGRFQLDLRARANGHGACCYEKKSGQPALQANGGHDHGCEPVARLRFPIHLLWRSRKSLASSPALPLISDALYYMTRASASSLR